MIFNLGQYMRKRLNRIKKSNKGIDARHRSVHRRLRARVAAQVRQPRHNNQHNVNHQMTELLPDAETLARLLEVPLRTAQRWAQHRQLPKHCKRLFAALSRGDMHPIWPDKKGWRSVYGAFITDLGQEIALEQIRALPYLIQALAAHQAELRELRKQVASMATVTRLERVDIPKLGAVTIDDSPSSYAQIDTDTRTIDADML